MTWYWSNVVDLGAKFDALGAKIDALTSAIIRLRSELMFDFSKILAAVAAEKTADDSIIALVTSMSAQIKDVSAKLAAAIAASDPAAMAAAQAQLDSLAGELSNKTTDVVNAVNANTTPATPAPAPTPATP